MIVAFRVTDHRNVEGFTAMSKRTWVAATTAAVIVVPMIAWGWQDGPGSPPAFSPEIGLPDPGQDPPLMAEPPAAPTPPEPEAFLEQNRNLVEQQVADLTDEYKKLHAQMQQVEAKLRHWQRIQQALASVDDMAAPSPVATPTSGRVLFDLDAPSPPLPSEPQSSIGSIPAPARSQSVPPLPN